MVYRFVCSKYWHTASFTIDHAKRTFLLVLQQSKCVYFPLNSLHNSGKRVIIIKLKLIHTKYQQHSYYKC